MVLFPELIDLHRTAGGRGGRGPSIAGRSETLLFSRRRRWPPPESFTEKDTRTWEATLWVSCPGRRLWVALLLLAAALPRVALEEWGED